MESNATELDRLATVQTALTHIKAGMEAVALPVISERKLNSRQKKKTHSTQ